MGNKEWRKVKISNIGKVVSGGTPSTKKKEYWGNDISWITPKDLANHKLKYIFKGERSISVKGLNNSSAKLLPKGAVLLTTRAPIGYLAISGKELATNQGFKSIICNKDIIDNNFLYYLLHTKINELESIAGGSTFKEINTKLLKNFEINIPDLLTQKKIANLLTVFDNKIEINNKINETLESIAKAIYHEWFVKFNFPNEDGLPYKDSGGKFYKTELGEIPVGWIIVKIKDISKKVITGKTPRIKDIENFGNDIPFITIPDMKNKIWIVKTDRYLSKIGESKQKNKTLPKGTICVSCIATPGLVSLTTIESQTNQQINSIICKNEVSKYYVFFYLKRKKQEIINLSSGGTTTYNLNKRDFENMTLILPENKLMKAFDKQISQLLDQILIIQNQNIKLKKLKEILLNKLISGQIDVDNLNINWDKLDKTLKEVE